MGSSADACTRANASAGHISCGPKRPGCQAAPCRGESCLQKRKKTGTRPVGGQRGRAGGDELQQRIGILRVDAVGAGKGQRAGGVKHEVVAQVPRLKP